MYLHCCVSVSGYQTVSVHVCVLFLPANLNCHVFNGSSVSLHIMSVLLKMVRPHTDRTALNFGVSQLRWERKSPLDYSKRFKFSPNQTPNFFWLFCFSLSL